MAKKEFSRRGFISKTAAGVVGVTVLSNSSSMSAASYNRIIGSNDRINIGFLGCGARSNGHQSMVKTSAKDKNLAVVAVCDIWKLNKEKAVANCRKLFGTDVKQFKYSEEMLKMPELDAVMIGTGDFQHAKTATGNAVTFKDTKEGMFGIRVARQLELPSKEDVTLTDAQGNPTTVKAMSNEGVTGNYRSSEGVTGEAAWGTRAKWMDLYGSIGDENISLIICDHPKNLSYPTYWHARGYGLFAANPFGVKDFTKGKEELNYSIPSGKSLTLRYRIIVSSGNHLTDAEINGYADDFASKY